MSSAIFYGHLVGEFGLRVDPKRVEAIIKYPEPTNVDELRRALGMFGFFRRLSGITEILLQSLSFF